jgi:hypothetical protein
MSRWRTEDFQDSEPVLYSGDSTLGTVQAPRVKSISFFCKPKCSKKRKQSINFSSKRRAPRKKSEKSLLHGPCSTEVAQPPQSPKLRAAMAGFSLLPEAGLFVQKGNRRSKSRAQCKRLPRGNGIAWMDCARVGSWPVWEQKTPG